ncbi:hypothetical protein [Pontiella agarivorans]|uniref:DUF4468 domain-containing protein n=1 Tax=Pontiella agarivorans TaxID=3038953 RepID=A0ABU5N188_9BACT|nr:hypothetical protein [Pontiella agarivorans]MDZ8120195.1 hypothetical protein [Pontiella agarivorans]
MKNCKHDRCRMIRGALGFAVLLCGISVRALETLPLLPDGASKTLLESRNPIYCETEGRVPVDYAQALKVYAHPDLLVNVQAAYSEHVLKEGAPEFSIQQTAEKKFHYVNRKKERTDISEIFRRETSDTTFDIILYSSGKRFFGNYQAVIHVQLLDCGDAGVGYVASVYAYPENAVSRFFSRHLGLVEKYFNKKTGHLTEMITVISRSLCEQAAVAQDEPEERGSQTS